MVNMKVTYILVSDGAKARIYASDTNKHNLRLVNSFESQVARMHSRDLGSEKPHRIFERNRRESRVNLHVKAEEEFIHYIAELLNKGAAMHEFQSLVLISPPKFLGELRSMLEKNTIAFINKEIIKDLTHMDEKKLETYIWGK